MTYEQRLHRDYFSGTLSLAASVSDVTLSSSAFTALGTAFSTTAYMPLELHNPSTGIYEVVWITGHAAASQTVTVVRGRENTTALAWPQNTQIIDAVTKRDLVPDYTRATLPTDPSIGMRALVTDESNVVARMLAGWGPAIGMANAAAMGPNRSAANPPSSANFLLSMGYGLNLTPNASGIVSVTWRQAFPTACFAAFAWSCDYTQYIGWCTPTTESTTGASFRLTGVSGTITNGPLSIIYLGVGY